MSIMRNNRVISHPGEYLLDAINSLGMTQNEFAIRVGILAKTINTHRLAARLNRQHRFVCITNRVTEYTLIRQDGSLFSLCSCGIFFAAESVCSAFSKLFLLEK